MRSSPRNWASTIVRYKIEFKKKVVKSLKKFIKSNKIILLKVLDKIRERPLLGKFLHYNFKDLRSVRMGPFRIIYRINNERGTILIVKIEHKKNVYKI